MSSAVVPALMAYKSPTAPGKRAQVFGETRAVFRLEISPLYNFPVNDRLPYADVSIAAVLVAVGTALAASPWLEGTAILSLALATMLAVLAMADLINRSGRRADSSQRVQRTTPRRVTSAHCRGEDFARGSV